VDQLQKLKTDCSFRLEELMSQPQMDAAQANVLSAIMMRAGDRIEMYKKPDDISMMEKLRLEFLAVQTLNSRGASMNIGPLPEVKRISASPLVSVPNSGSRSSSGEDEQ
jgi:hypothetical protein